MRFIFLFVIAGFVLLLSSCRTQKAITNYIEDMTDTASKKTFFITEPKIQKNDQLSINISSLSIDPKTDELYNPKTEGYNQQTPQLYGYLVDQKGDIEIPRVGIIHAEGLTKDQLAAIIKDRLRGQLNDPTVIIRFVNFRVMVMGEVGRPGVQGVSVENLNILEALAMAGDITLFGNKKKVKVVREVNGQRQVGMIDVSSSSMFESPYYQLQQNDVVLVEATKYKVAQTEQQRVSQQLGFALSIITSIALLYNIFR